jgi:pimeloyl-ACP methyl ester carboxylesterase
MAMEGRRLGTEARLAGDFVHVLADRFDPEAFDARRRVVRVRLAVEGADSREWDVVIRDGSASVAKAGGEPDAVLSAPRSVWRRLCADLPAAMDAYWAGRLSVRRNMHVGIGFLAATSADRAPGRLRFHSVQTPQARVSVLEAGTGPAILALHGLGATKASFLPTVAALAGRFRVIAADHPGFGDSEKPIGARYDAAYFAETAVGILDALELERANIVGNSLGGRVALEMGLVHPERVERLGLLAPSLAWLRPSRLRPVVKLARPELGLVQLAPRRIVEGVLARMIPGSGEGWAAVGVDEFLRAYLTPSGRAAFYAAARQILLEEANGEDGFWTRLQALETPSLFIWGRNDRLVPIGFARHVSEAAPRARHLELDCGHVPQLERARETHQALAAFFAHARRFRRAA